MWANLSLCVRGRYRAVTCAAATPKPLASFPALLYKAPARARTETMSHRPPRASHTYARKPPISYARNKLSPQTCRRKRQDNCCVQVAYVHAKPPPPPQLQQLLFVSVFSRARALLRDVFVIIVNVRATPVVAARFGSREKLQICLAREHKTKNSRARANHTTI